MNHYIKIENQIFIYKSDLLSNFCTLILISKKAYHNDIVLSNEVPSTTDFLAI